MNTRSIVALIVSGLALLGGCASGAPGSGASRRLGAQERALRTFDPAASSAFDGASGERIGWADLAQRASEADAVIIGEVHGHPAGLALAAALFDEILARAPSSAALSLEFFARDQQAAIDDYLTQITDEPAFRDATGRTAGTYPPGHRAMVEAAKAAGVPVIASNAPRRYVRLARTDGFDRLRALHLEQRRLFATPEELSGGDYRDRFFDLMAGMAGHGGGPDAGSADAPETDEERAGREARTEQKIESFFRGQNVWDATMAESVARAIGAGRRPVVQVVGRFHVEFDGGLVQRLGALTPDAKILTIVMVDEDADALPDEDRGRGDVVVYVGE